MQVFLDQITFNHDQSSATTDAFNIRRNETETVTIPEWRRLVCVNPGDSPAAYARDELTGTPTIQAKFSFDGFAPGVERVWIRAIDPQKAQGVFQLIFRVLEGVTGVKLKSNVLGSVIEQEVALADAGQFQTFQLRNVRIDTSGVSVSDVIWRWQFRTETTNWTNFETSTHRIYTVLKMPNEPWRPGPSTTPTVQTPWTDVLDYACAWAARAQTIDEAASLITTAVHNLGTASVVEYAFDQSGPNSYVYDEPPRFDCTDFIKLLRGQPNNNGPGVNCEDCAAIVGSFSNIVGHDLFQSKMDKDFELNPHKLIGLANIWTSSFTFHAVAWKDPCDEDSELFDACVQLDFDSDPSLTIIPPDALFRVPHNIRFGRIGETEYRFRLVTSADEESCVPRPSEKVRRRIGLSATGAPAMPFAASFGEFAGDRYGFKTWKGTRKLDQNLFVYNFFFGGNEFSNWMLDNLRLIKQTQSAPIIQAFLKSKNFGDKVSIRIDIHEKRSLLDAHASLLKILSGFHLPDIVRQEDASYGDVVFAVPSNFVTLFARANLVFLLRNAGRGRASCEPLAKAIDNLIISKPHSDKSGSLFSLNGQYLKPHFSPEENDRRQFKIFSSGEVFLDNEQLVYHSTLDKQQPLEIFAIDAVGRIEKQLLTVESLKEHKHETQI